MYNTQQRPGQPAYPQNPGYPQPQGGYMPQQGGYPPQGGYQPQPGYPQQPQQQFMTQQGGYPQQQAYGQPQQQMYGQPQQQMYGTQQRPGQPMGQMGQPMGQQQMMGTQMGTQNPMATNQGWAMQYAANISPQELQVMQQWFQSVDRDRSGSISGPELAGVLFNQRPIGLGVANKLIRVFDKDGSGSIDFREYCALHQFLNAMQNAFFAADRDRSGFIDANEMFTAVQGAGFQLSFTTIQALVQKFSTPGRGVDFPNYLFMCAHLAHLRSIFEWNDTDRDGRITVTYDALAHIGTDILPS